MSKRFRLDLFLHTSDESCSLEFFPPQGGSRLFLSSIHLIRWWRLREGWKGLGLD